MDWAEWRQRRQKAPATTRVPLCADGDALAALEEAQRSRDPDVRATIATLKEQVAAATMQVVCTQLPADDYQDLKDNHRPTDPDAAKRGDEWDEDTFAPALIAASVTPPMTLEEATEWWHDRGPGAPSAAERAQLFLACRDLNETVPDLGFTGPGTDETDGTGRPSTT